MKIWYQSSSSHGFVPVWDEYGKTLEKQSKFENFWQEYK